MRLKLQKKTFKKVLDKLNSICYNKDTEKDKGLKVKATKKVQKNLKKKVLTNSQVPAIIKVQRNK
jgi:hypothetical protein